MCRGTDAMSSHIDGFDDHDGMSLDAPEAERSLSYL